MAIEGIEPQVIGNTGIPENAPELATNTDYQSIKNLIAIDKGIYKFMDDAYFGHGGFRSGMYLVPGMAEIKEALQRRQDMVFYKNYVQPVVRAMIDPVFNHKIVREIDAGQVDAELTYANAFLSDADACGSSISELVDEACTHATLHGASFVVIDNYPEAEQPESKVEAINNRIYPFAYVRKLAEVDSYVTDRRGRLESIVFLDDVVTDSKGQCIRYLSGWYKDRYEAITEVQAKNGDPVRTVETTPITIGRLPVVTVRTAKRKKPKDIFVDPPLFDIARVNAGIFNKDSEIREQERKQGFALLYVQEEKPGNLIASRSNYVSLPTGVSLAPGFATPPPDILRALIESSEKLREDLFRMANQKGVDFSTKDAKSGDALAWEFQAQEATLKKTAMMAEKCEYEIMALVEAYTNEGVEYTVKYSDKFGPSSDGDDLTNIDKVILMDMPPRPKAYLQKKAFMVVTKNDEREEVDELLDAFEVEEKEPVVKNTETKTEAAPINE